MYVGKIDKMRINKPLTRSNSRAESQTRPLTRESAAAAEALAIAALGFLAGDPERISRFLSVTGVDPADLRRAAAEPGFAAGVLDYLCGDEETLVAFAQDQGIAPERIAQARRVIAGPGAEDW